MGASEGPRRFQRSRAASAAGVALGWLAWAGCAAPVTEAPPVAIPATFAEAGGAVAAPDRWWTAWGEPELSARIERALAANLDLEAVWQTLQAAEAVAVREGAGRWPSLEGRFAMSDQRVDGGGRFRDAELGLAANYEVDLWGRVRSGATAARARAEAAAADLQAAAVSLSAEVTLTYFQIVEAHSQRELLQAQRESNRQVLRSLRARFGSGLIRSADVLRQQQLIERNQEQLAVIEARIGVLNHQLAVLEGRAPAAGPVVAGRPLPAVAPLPATGVPAALVQRRPDVRAAFHRLRAANAEVAAAVADRYPRISLSAALATEGDRPGDLFDTWVRTLAGQVVAPLFEAGARAAESRRAEAEARASLAVYGQTVLRAVQEVEDALVQERGQRERIARLERQVELSHEAYRRLLNEYFNGVTDYLDVLTASIEEQQLRRDLLAARRTLLDTRVAVYRALAGDITTDRDELAALVAAGPERPAEP